MSKIERVDPGGGEELGVTADHPGVGAESSSRRAARPSSGKRRAGPRAGNRDGARAFGIVSQDLERRRTGRRRRGVFRRDCRARGSKRCRRIGRARGARAAGSSEVGRPRPRASVAGHGTPGLGAAATVCAGARPQFASPIPSRGDGRGNSAEQRSTWVFSVSQTL